MVRHAKELAVLNADDPLCLAMRSGLQARRLGLVSERPDNPDVLAHLAGCHALLLECNHDPDLLAKSTYPAFLKKRVGGPYGHLSNEAAADIARAIAHPGLVKVVAAHLSAQNNRPALALSALTAADAPLWGGPELLVADPLNGTDWVQVSA